MSLGGPSASDKSFERSISQQQMDLAQQQNQRSQQLYNSVAPGLQTAEDYYKKIASGDPSAIWTSIAPAVDQITGQKNAAKQQIQATMPAGGERRLAMENADISAASNIGRTATSAYTSSFPALASLAGQGIGLSTNQIANAISAFGGAASTTNNVMQSDAASKAATMGLFGSMAGAAGMAAGHTCWIAAELFGGWLEPRTIAVREWLAHDFARGVAGRVVVNLYRRFGERVALQVRRHRSVRMLFAPVFNAALRRAVQPMVRLPRLAVMNG